MTLFSTCARQDHIEEVFLKLRAWLLSPVGSRRAFVLETVAKRREKGKEGGGAEKVPHIHLGLLEAPQGAGSEAECTGMIQGNCV